MVKRVDTHGPSHPHKPSAAKASKELKALSRGTEKSAAPALESVARMLAATGPKLKGRVSREHPGSKATSKCAARIFPKRHQAH